MSPLLEKLAQLTGGRSFVATDADALDDVFRTIDSLEKSPIRGQILTRYDEHFAVYAGLALTLLLVERFLRQGSWGDCHDNRLPLVALVAVDWFEKTNPGKAVRDGREPAMSFAHPELLWLLDPLAAALDLDDSRVDGDGGSGGSRWPSAAARRGTEHRRSSRRSRV